MPGKPSKEINSPAVFDFIRVNSRLKKQNEVAPQPTLPAPSEIPVPTRRTCPRAAKYATAETAKLQTDTEQGEAAAMYPEAQALAVSIINTIEFHLSERPDLDAPGRRRIARAWGVIYINDDGTVEEEPVPAPVPPVV